MDKPKCMECEHNKPLTFPIFRKCEAGAFTMLHSGDCADLPFFVLERCPKYKEQIKNQVTNKNAQQ